MMRTQTQIIYCSKITLRILSVILVCLLNIIALQINVFASDAPNFVLTQGSAKQGQTVDISLSIANNPGVAAMQLNVISNSSLSLKNCNAGDAFSSATVVKSPDGVTPASILWADQNATASDGEMLVLSFDVDIEALAGYYTIIVQCVSANDQEENDIVIPQKTTTIQVLLLPDNEKPTIAVSSATGAKDEVVAVKITATNNFSAAAANLNISYDGEDLELVNILKSTDFPGTLYCGQESAIITWVELDEIGPGDIAVCYFRIKSNVDEQFPTSISISGSLYDINEAQIMNVIFLTGSISLLEERPTIAVSSSSGAEGELIALKIKATNSFSAAAANLNINYNDEALELVSILKAAAFPGTLNCEKESAMITWLESDEIGAGDIAICYFRVRPNVAEKFPTNVSISGSLYDIDNIPISNVLFSSGFAFLTTRSPLEIHYSSGVVNVSGNLARQSIVSNQQYFVSVCDDKGKMLSIKQLTYEWAELEMVSRVNFNIATSAEHGRVIIFSLDSDSFCPLSAKRSIDY